MAAHTQTLKSIAGCALVGPGLLILVENLDGMAAQLKALLSTPVEGLGLLSSVILAASFDHHRLLQSLLQTLAAFWPLLFVMVGAVLLRDTFTENFKIVGSTQQKMAEKDAGFVDLSPSFDV